MAYYQIVYLQVISLKTSLKFSDFSKFLKQVYFAIPGNKFKVWGKSTTVSLLQPISPNDYNQKPWTKQKSNYLRTLKSTQQVDWGRKSKLK